MAISIRRSACIQWSWKKFRGQSYLGVYHSRMDKTEKNCGINRRTWKMTSPWRTVLMILWVRTTKKIWSLQECIKKVRKLKALDNVSVTCKGVKHCVIGPNASGKTNLIKPFWDGNAGQWFIVNGNNSASLEIREQRHMPQNGDTGQMTRPYWIWWKIYGAIRFHWMRTW